MIKPTIKQVNKVIEDLSYCDKHPKQLIEEVIEVLQELVDSEGTSRKYDTGICSQVENDEVFWTFFPTWERWSGCRAYPVPAEGFENSQAGYHEMGRLGELWEGEQLQLRMCLCVHLIDQLKQALEIMENEL